MAADPALSASFMTGGRGSLFGPAFGMNAGDVSDIKNSLQSAAGWMMALDRPSALSAALQPRDDFSLVNGADGSLYRVHKQSGQVTRVAGPKSDIVDIGSGPLGAVKGIKEGDVVKDFAGNIIAGPGAPSGGATSTAPGMDPGMAQLVRPGVRYDDSLTGLERLKQYKPEFEQDVLSYMRGEKMPVGRGDKYTQWVGREARRVGSEIGEPVDEATFSARRKSLNEIASETPGTAGGQAVAGIATLRHLSEGPAAFDALHNGEFGGPAGYIPGTTTLSHLVNNIGNSRANQAGAVAGLADWAERYGGESTKLYSGNRGAAEERARIAHAFGSPSLTPSEASAALRMERSLVAERLDQQIAHLQITLGANHPKLQELKQQRDVALAKVDAELAAMRKPGSPAAAPSPANKGKPLPNGWSVTVD